VCGHLGHLSGPYVAADVFARFLRAEGHQVALTGATAGGRDTESGALVTGTGKPTCQSVPRAPWPGGRTARATY